MMNSLHLGHRYMALPFKLKQLRQFTATIGWQFGGGEGIDSVGYRLSGALKHRGDSLCV